MPDWPHLTDDLPAPRDDEPSSLRQDIADELADHLNCAFTRELHLTRDEEKAKEKTLDRFGDPRKIARKLWLDAMQEKLMSQRMTFVALVVVLLASLGSTGLTWFLVDQARQVNQTMLDQSREANAALLEQSQKSNDAFLEKLTQLTTIGTASPVTSDSLEWNPVKIQLVTDEQPPKPAVGYDIKLAGRVLDAGKDETIARKSDEKGIADFGLVRPGDHNLYVTTPWEERREQATITVFPGHPLTRKFVCPAVELGKARIDFAVEWPDDLKNKELWVVCKFLQEPRRLGNDEKWSPNSVGLHVILINAKGQAIPFSLAPYTRGPRFLGGSWPFDETAPQRDLSGLVLARSQQRPSRQLPELNFIFRNVATESALEWPAATHYIQELLVAMPPEPLTVRDQWTPDGETPEKGQSLDLFRKMLVVGGLTTDLNRLRNASSSKDGKKIRVAWVPDEEWSQDSRNPYEQIYKALPRFVATPGQSNHFRIPIPDRLAAVVRESLSAQEAGQPSAKSE